MGSERERVEDSILAAGDSLDACVKLISRRLSLASWPECHRENLLAACFSAPSDDAIEFRKAANLRWHLFRGADQIIPANLPPNGPSSERIRADLVGLVKLGAGRYLVGELSLGVPLETHTMGPRF
jgi:hypothetical protein